MRARGVGVCLLCVEHEPSNSVPRSFNEKSRKTAYLAEQPEYLEAPIVDLQ